jgi:hypothetical protein
MMLADEDRSKVKVTLQLAKKAHRESRHTALLFLEPRSKMGWVVNATPRPLYPRTRHQLYRRLGGLQGQSGRVWKISFPLEYASRTAHLYRMRYPSPQREASSVQAYYRSTGFPNVGSPTFLENRHKKMIRLSALRTGRLYPPGNIPITQVC